MVEFLRTQTPLRALFIHVGRVLRQFLWRSKSGSGIEMVVEGEKWRIDEGEVCVYSSAHVRLRRERGSREGTQPR